MKILAVIPARGGSKSVPLKNIALVAGKPLLGWTVDAALSCPEIEWVVVSTDHAGIAACARDHGAEVIDRPGELAQDDTPTSAVLVHAYEWAIAQGRQVDAVITLQPTSPLRTARHMSEAISLFVAHPEADSLVSVQEVPHQFGPDALMQVDDIWGRPVAANIVLRRQDKVQHWARNGAAIYLTRSERLRKFVWGGKTLVYPMNKLSSVDIDDAEDVKLADALLRLQHSQNGVLPSQSRRGQLTTSLTQFSGEHRMKIDYRRLGDHTPVDIEQLRPKGSYANLIAQRTHSIDELVREYGAVPADLLKKRDCPGCGGEECVPELQKDHLSLVRCKQCDLVYVNPVFDEAHYEETYRSGEYQRIVKKHGEKSHEYRRDRFGSERVEIMKRHLQDNAKPSFLDIGCSTGFVVEAALAEGWDAEGIDLNPSAIAFGRERNLPLHECTFQSYAANGKTFDVIGLFDVLEHILYPKQLLEQVIAHLNPGGIVFIYVPNYDSASRLLMGKDAHFIWPTHHLTYFTPTTLKSFVEDTGVSVEMIMTEGLDMVDYIWTQEEKADKEMGAMKEVADLFQFFINGSLYGKNLRVIARK